MTESLSWGKIQVIFKSDELTVSYIEIYPNASSPIMSGDRASKHWVWTDNRYRKVPPGDRNWLVNPSGETMRLIEVKVGKTG